MDKKLVGLLGAASAVASLGPGWRRAALALG